MYALLDWDGTLRDDATLFCWEDYLVRTGVIDNTVVLERERLRNEYRQGKINHDDLSREACVTYLSALAGMSRQQYFSLIDAYMPEDRRHYSPHTEILFRWLKKHDIQPIVVSGAPHDVICQYFQEFHITQAYDFVCDFKDEKLSPVYVGSGGHDKQKIVEYCQTQWNEPPILAMGDSASDVPMLRAAKFPIIVGKALRSQFPDALALDYTASSAEKLESYLTEAEKNLF